MMTGAQLSNKTLEMACMPKVGKLHNFLKEYLDAGHDLKDLRQQYGIATQEKGNLIIFKYSQEESPKDEPIVRESRGIILEKDTGKIIHYPFYRFFNYGELPNEDASFNWQNAVVSEKLDGSILGIFNYNGQWELCTSSQIGGENLVARAPFTYRELVDMATGGFDSFSAKLNPRYDYTFELVSPFNRIITPYDNTTLYLIGCRDKENNFREIPFFEAYETDGIVPESVQSKLKIPKIFSIKDESGNFRSLEDIRSRANELKQTDEGFVVIDFSAYDSDTGSFPRMKVKNQNYLAIKYLNKSDKNLTATYEDLLRIVIQAEEAEFLTAMPHFKDLIQSVKDKWVKFNQDVNETLDREDVKQLLLVSTSERLIQVSQLAKLLQDCPYNKFLLSSYKKGGDTFQDMLNNIQKKYGEERFCKILWGVVKKYC